MSEQLKQLLTNRHRRIQGVQGEHSHSVGLRQNSQISLFLANVYLILSFSTP